MTINELYEVYKKQYTKSVRGNKGNAAYDMATLQDFTADIQSEINDFNAAGYKYSGSEVAKQMAKTDAYGITKFQYDAQVKATEEFNKLQGINQSIQKVRYNVLHGNNEDFWTSVKTRRSELKSLGMNNKDITLLISQEYFGSK